MLENYPTARADLRLRLPSQRYFEQEEEVELSPRNFGILMHKAFENADDEEQIRLAVERMQADGHAFRRRSRRPAADDRPRAGTPAAAMWFAGGWSACATKN